MKNIFFALALIFIAINVSGQNLEAPSSIRVLMEPAEEINTDDNQLDPFAAISPGTPMNMKLMVGINSTLNLHEIQIKVGTSNGGSEIIEHVYDFDDFFDNGTLSYDRQDDQIILGLGEHPYADTIYCEVYFKDEAGNTSPVKFYPEL